MIAKKIVCLESTNPKTNRTVILTTNEDEWVIDIVMHENGNVHRKEIMDVAKSGKRSYDRRYILSELIHDHLEENKNNAVSKLKINMLLAQMMEGMRDKKYKQRHFKKE